MRRALFTKAAGIAIFAIVASRAASQPPADTSERVLRYARTETPQRIQEIATAIRAIAEIRQASVPTQERVLALKGTPGQMAMAEWLFAKLDQLEVPGPLTATSEYRAPSGADDVVRVFYLAYPQTVQAFQEVATAIRSTAEIRYGFTYNALKAMIVRGSGAQIAMAERLVNQLYQPRSAPAREAVFQARSH